MSKHPVAMQASTEKPTSEA